MFDEGFVAEALEGFPQRCRRVDDQRLERDDGGGFRFAGGVSGDFELADHLRDPVSGFRQSGRLARQHRTRRSLGVAEIGLAVVASLPPDSSVDLHDPVATAAQVTSEAGTVTAGALDAETPDTAQSLRPRLELGVTPAVGAHGALG